MPVLEANFMLKKLQKLPNAQMRDSKAKCLLKRISSAQETPATDRQGRLISAFLEDSKGDDLAAVRSEQETSSRRER